MSHPNIDKFVNNNEGSINEFLSEAKSSRLKHSAEDRIFALEVMVSAIGASIEGDAHKNLCSIMNSFSEASEPTQNKTLKAVADLNVLSGDFKKFLADIKKN